jgi:hypothetical protein
VLELRAHEYESLIEERLRFGVRGRDGMMMHAESGQEHDRARARRSICVMLRVERERGGEEKERDHQQTLHLNFSFCEVNFIR